MCLSSDWKPKGVRVPGEIWGVREDLDPGGFQLRLAPRQEQDRGATSFTGVVHGELVSLLGEVLAVAGGGGLFGNAFEFTIDMSKYVVQKVDQSPQGSTGDEEHPC